VAASPWTYVFHMRFSFMLPATTLFRNTTPGDGHGLLYCRFGSGIHESALHLCL
jgi:hypothetical protein